MAEEERDEGAIEKPLAIQDPIARRDTRSIGIGLSVMYWPAIMEFLGYFPYQEARSFGRPTPLCTACTGASPTERSGRCSASTPDHSHGGRRDRGDRTSGREG